MIEIVIDTREQHPFTFVPMVDVIACLGTLPTGDYSLRGFESAVTVERKTLDDLIGCLTHDRSRFKHELERMRGFNSAAVVVEAPREMLLNGNYHSQMRPASAWQSVVSIMQEYRLPFQFCDGREDAERFVYDFLRHFHRHRLNQMALPPYSPL